MSISNKELKKYYRQISYLLPIHRKQERLFIKKVKEDVTNFVSNNQDVTYDDIVDRFDEPINVVYNYISSLDPEELRKALSVARLKKITLVILIVLLFALFIIRTVFLYILFKASFDSIVTIEQTVIGG